MDKAIFAIDPGPTESAFVRYDPIIGVCSFGKVENANIPSPWITDHVVIEMIASYGMSVGQEVFETCVFIGRLLERWEGNHAASLSRLTRHMVKMHICKSARANDSNIRAALIDRFGGPQSIKKDGQLYKVSKDVWAALAVAVTAAETTERYV